MQEAKLATIIAASVTIQALSSLPALAASTANERQLTQLGSRLVYDSNAARNAVRADNIGKANSDLDQALALQTSMAHLAHLTGMTMIVPLYSEFDSTTVLSDATNSRRGTQRSEKTSQAGLIARSNVAQVTYLAIDLDKTKQRLAAAKRDLGDHHPQAARDSLAAIQSDLIVGRIATDVPLLTARQDLSLAQQALKSHEVATASADLKQAAASLNTYTKSGHRGDARRLAADIESAMPLDAPRRQTVLAKIDAWWGSVKNWFTRTA